MDQGTGKRLWVDSPDNVICIVILTEQHMYVICIDILTEHHNYVICIAMMTMCQN